MSKADPSPATVSKLKLIIKLSLLAAFLLVLNYGSRMAVEQINVQLWPQHEHLIITALWFSIGVYILWMAMPFVPGIELGLGLMVLLGPKGVFLVYVCTLLSLSVSFVIGRLIPLKSFARLLGWLHLRKSKELVLDLEPLDPDQKLNFILKTVPSKIIPFLAKHRYLMIALALNLPGNALIGGGGGIGLIAGMCRMFPFHKYVLLIGIAITPLPLLFLAGKSPG